MVTRFYKLLLIATLAFLLVHCGGAGTSEEESCGLCGPMSDLSGSITSQFGTQAQMQGWVLVLFEKSSGISRVAEVDSSGLYTFGNARTTVDHTLALLSPDYILQSVLSVPSTTPNQIQQFFRPQAKNLPRLIHSGPIIRMQDQTGIKMSPDAASDTNGDGIPDGSQSIGGADPSAFSLQAGAAVPDLDLDGLPNDIDPDIDADGVINVLDPDDDGDAIYDVFDPDANGDFVNDTTQTNGDLYYDDGVEFVGVQFEMKPKENGSGNDLSLLFTTKVRTNVGPRAVQIRGAPSLLNDATIQAVNAETGEVTSAAWDRLLLDNGTSNDSSADDRIFAQKVFLADGKQPPRAHEMVFFQLAFGTDENPWYLEFPFIFPPVTPAAITAQVAAVPGQPATVTLGGYPFGVTLQDFVWSINLFDETGLGVWTSQPIAGTTKQFQIPSNVRLEDTEYKFSVVAQVLDKVPGYPTYTIHSPLYDLP
jgi:hypothetical protein